MPVINLVPCVVWLDSGASDDTKTCAKLSKPCQPHQTLYSYIKCHNVPLCAMYTSRLWTRMWAFCFFFCLEELMDLRQEAALEAARQRLRPDLQHRVTITPSISFYCSYSNDLQCVFVKDVFKAHVPSAFARTVVLLDDYRQSVRRAVIVFPWVDTKLVLPQALWIKTQEHFNMLPSFHEGCSNTLTNQSWCQYTGSFLKSSFAESCGCKTQTRAHQQAQRHHDDALRRTMTRSFVYCSFFFPIYLSFRSSLQSWSWSRPWRFFCRPWRRTVLFKVEYSNRH